MNLLPILSFSHDLLKRTIQPGNHVVDATCGNGKDTALLAQLVGPSGKVYAFDVQKQAIEKTKKHLEALNLTDAVILIHDSHANLSNYTKKPINAAIFNLGYLPGGDKNRTTLPETTITALTHILRFLLPGGLIIVVIYHGHKMGKIERQHVEAFVKTLPQQHYHVLHYRFTNQRNNAPYLIAIEKRTERQTAHPSKGVLL